MTVVDESTEQRTERLLSGVRSLAWLDTQTFPPLQWAVPGLVPEGFGLLVGPPKLGKSWLALDVGLAVAMGGRALGRVDCPQRPVFYAALEDGDRRLQDRARKIMAGQALPDGFDYVTKATALDIVPLIAAWLEQHPTGLVLLDTLGRVMPPAMSGETPYMRDYRVGAVLKNLTDSHPGSTLLVVHHTRKQAASDWVDTVSGTAGLAGSADFTIALTRTRGDDGALIQVTGRDVCEDDYAATIADGHWRLDGATLAESASIAKEVRATVGMGDTGAAVVQLVGRHPEGMRAADVARELDMTPDAARQALRRAEDSGRIRRADRGLYMGVTSVTTSRSPSTGRDNVTDVTPPGGGSLSYLPGMRPVCRECGLPIDPAIGDVHPSCDS